MTISRRSFLSTASGAAALATVPGLTRQSHAQLALGEIQIDVVSDGFLTLPGSFVFDPMPQALLAPLLDKLGQPADTLTPPCNVTLLRHGDRVVLFDAGSGPAFSPNSGILINSLDALGVAPDDVTDIVFTHAHPDHLWGVLDDFDDLLFPQASYMMGQAEWDYWRDPDTIETIEEARAAFAVGAARRMDRIADNMHLFRDGEEVLPGVAARATFGHTPGHMAFEVRAGAESVMILGDSISNDHVALARPEWPSGSDQDTEAAARTRVALLDQLQSEKSRVIGFHLTGNGLGYIDTSTDGYVFVPEEPS